MTEVQPRWEPLNLVNERIRVSWCSNQVVPLLHTWMYFQKQSSPYLIFHCRASLRFISFTAFIPLTTCLPHWHVPHECGTFVSLVYCWVPAPRTVCLAHVRCSFHVCRTHGRSYDKDGGIRQEGNTGYSDSTSWASRLSQREAPEGREVRVRLESQPGRAACRLESRAGVRACTFPTRPLPCAQRAQLSVPALPAGGGGPGSGPRGSRSSDQWVPLSALRSQSGFQGQVSAWWKDLAQRLAPGYFIQGSHCLCEFACFALFALRTLCFLGWDVIWFHSQVMWVSFFPGSMNY